MREKPIKYYAIDQYCKIVYSVQEENIQWLRR